MTAKEQGPPGMPHRRGWRMFAMALAVFIVLAMVAMNEFYRAPEVEETPDTAATVLVDPAN
jgi:hypothetical protein